MALFNVQCSTFNVQCSSLDVQCSQLWCTGHCYWYVFFLSSDAQYSLLMLFTSK